MNYLRKRSPQRHRDPTENHGENHRESFSGRLLSPAVLVLLSSMAAHFSIAGAQTARQSSDPPERYRIGPGDVLEIRVFNRPQLSRDAVRVEGGGMIRMPLVEGDI